MLIEVIRCDNRCDSIEESMLDGLIETHGRHLKYDLFL